MTNELITVIKQLPGWVLLLTPILIVALVTFIVTRAWRSTWRISGLLTLVIWLTAGFYFWRLYLLNHFAGRFDAFGLPTELYRSGLYLLIDAWPIWFFPTSVAIIITSAWFLWRSGQRRPTTITQPDTSSTVPHPDMSLQLEIEKLKQQLVIAKQKLHTAQTGAAQPSKLQQIKQENIHRDLTHKLERAHLENQQLSAQNTSLENDLLRAKSLIERLLDDRLENND
jgi:hypothetical protein